MSKRGVEKEKPWPFAKNDIATQKEMNAKKDLWKGFYLSYRTCYYCKTIYRTVNNSLKCEYWHEGSIDAAGNAIKTK